ncbi:MAG: hypothetical protein JO213_13175 [Alphaproteobacteria bacterium]|nr:hypothetical protein [Alphaproteobacteria bacterium]
MAAVGLSLVAAAVPVCLLMQPALRAQLAPPQLGNSLLASLLATPAAVGLWLGLSGLGRILRFPDAASRALEPAVLRILVAGVLFGHSIAIGAAFGPTAAISRALLVAVAGLVGGWLILLAALVLPRASLWLRRGAMLFDILLISAFLHFGGQDAAGWYPLYLLLTAYAGFRFGSGALVGNAALSVLGFAVVAATTEFWQQEPALTAECGLALLLLPSLAYGPVRAVAEARRSAAATEQSKNRFVAVLAEALRAPSAENPGASPSNGAPMQPAEVPARAADVLDLAAIEAGTYAAPTEPFDLHAVLNDALIAARGAADSKGITLGRRIDPYLPYRLSGCRRSFARIVGNLLGYAIETTESGTVRLRVNGVGSDDERMQVVLSVESGAEPAPVIEAAASDPFAGQEAVQQNAIGLVLVRRLTKLMGGTFTVDTGPAGHARLTVELGFAIDGRAQDAPLDSAGCPVLIASGDSLFAGNVSEHLVGWDAPVSWIGEAEAALNYIAWLDPALRAVLVVDGRSKPLAMMSFVERALALDGAPPFVIFVAEPGQLAALGELEDGEVAALLPAPLNPRLLMNALHALPLRADPGNSRPAAEGAGQPPGNPVRMTTSDGRVTPIAAHPRFAGDSAPIVDPRRIEALRELGGQENFLADVIEAFRADAQQIMRRLTRAAAVADAAAFAQGVRALGETAGHVGGISLSHLTASLRAIGAAELREQGSLHLQRLEAEIERLAAALAHYPRQPGAQRP